MSQTLRELMVAQFQSDTEIGMSFAKDSSEDHYWRGVQRADMKMIEILDRYADDRIAEIKLGEKVMSKCKRGDPNCVQIGCDCYKPEKPKPDVNKLAEALPPPVDRTNQCTTSGEDPATVRAKQAEEGNTGQHSSYIILCDEERAKGFVRPLRRSYIHVGEGGHEIDPNDPSKHGRTYGACGAATTMGTALAETYARDPKFYGSTFCARCQKHLPVAEFKWEDGTVVGS